MIYLLLVLLSISIVRADYKCVCNYNVEKGVFAKESQDAKALGYLYEFDCKPVVSQASSTSSGWTVIAFEHQIGYVFKDPQTRVEVCQGDPTDSVQLPTGAGSLTTVTMETSSSSTEAATTSPTPTTDTTIRTSTTQPTTIRTTTARTLVCPPIVRQSALQEGSMLFINSFDVKCYEMVTQLQSWEYAEKDCNLKGGHLATIGDSKDESSIYNAVKFYGHATWIGLNDKNNEETFEWASGEPVVYLNWHHSRKDIYLHGTEDCVAIGPHTGTWEDVDCTVRYAYICEYDAVYGNYNDTDIRISTPPQTGMYTDGNTMMCQSSVQSAALNDSAALGQYKSSCYELISNIHVTWQHGESLCRDRGGHLAHIKSADEQGFMQYFMDRYSPQHAVWIGLHDTTVEGQFEWSSGVSVSYTNWVPRHTDHFGSHNKEDCVAFIPYKYGQWDDIRCGDSTKLLGDVGEVHPILCQYNLATSPVIG
ncbi:secretory phospholipase A2 receptor-like [Mercenaria mercenaria]|uniref:secretory phospholipase A2 receptor-like n=1 Tax=Mercenaria mercenaria TaxID=6596 RepID=UPI00234F29DE|nr:secretory phospholipase A2 receptor-like [Mercenaria mercenaria]